MVIQLRLENDIAQLVLNNPDRSANLLNQRFQVALEAVLDQVEALPKVKGVLLLSAKKDFLCGADLEEILAQTSTALIMVAVERFKRSLRRLEKLSCPVVALLNGSTLGGGYELALAAHHRVAIYRSGIRIGLPEVKLGLFPGGGGTQRLPRLLGIQKAIPLILEGKEFDPEQALEQGLVDHLVKDEAELFQYGCAWIEAHPEACQPWDQKGFCIPGGGSMDPKLSGFWAVAPSALRKKTRGHYPAPEKALSAVFEGCLTDIETGLRIESRYFAQVAHGNTAKNMLTAFWFQLNQIKRGESRPKAVDHRTFAKVGILGAGMMGAGIAYACAQAEISVVLKDRSKTLAEKGKDYSRSLVEKRLITEPAFRAEANRILERIYTTDHLADLQDCDLIIEAVFEDRVLKSEVYQEMQTRLLPGTIIASNTSTLPITGLAETIQRPGNFIGLHFFSPVDRMRLVEIIVGERTSESTLANAIDFVFQIGKIPIVVNDRRGFYTSRVFCTYLFEGLTLLSEGQNPLAIEAAGLDAGMPVGPLALADEISLGLMDHILTQTREDFLAEGKTYQPTPAEDVVKTMIEIGRLGRKKDQGFYNYSGSKKQIWSGLAKLYPPCDPLPIEDLKDRLIFIQVLETSRCFEEDVVTKVADANVGSILGWGFVPHKGGTLQFLNDFGIAAFNLRCEELRTRYGERFHPPEILFRMAEENATFK